MFPGFIARRQDDIISSFVGSFRIVIEAIEARTVAIITAKEAATTMSGPKPPPIELSESQLAVMERIRRRQTCAQRVVRRARIILEVAAGGNNKEVARRLGAHRDTVKDWRERWLDASEQLASMEETGDEKALAEWIETLLDDKMRSGAPATFSSEQVVQIVAVACEKPQDCGRPVSHWTPTELADEVVKRGIVESISPRSVGRFLKGGGPSAPSVSLLAESAPARPASLCRAGSSRL